MLLHQHQHGASSRTLDSLTPASAAVAAIGAVSSFAYQGTNSHVVLAAGGATPAALPQPWVWQRSRLWYQVGAGWAMVLAG